MTRVLMASIVDPSIQIGGAWTMTRALVRLLRENPLHAEVDVVAMRRRSPARHWLRQCVALGQALVSELPAKIHFSRSRSLRSRIDGLLRRRRFDLIVLNGSDLLWLLPYLPAGAKRLVVAHNIEHQLFAAQVAWRVGWIPAAGWLRTECERLRRFELEGLRQVRNVVFLSGADQRYALGQCPELRSITLPPVFEGVPAPRPVRAPGTQTLAVGMLANFDWWPNRQGLNWFLRLVLPHLSPGIQVHLFGTGSVRAARNRPRVVGHGYVPRVEDAWAACDFVICPVLSGGGVSVKLAEAVYHAVPVLATRFAARGLPLEPHPAIVLIDGADAWIAFINQRGSDLARERVPAEISAPFRIHAHAQTVSDFVLEVTGSAARGARAQ